MLPFSVRRAVTAAPLASTGLGSALAPAAPLIACSHQRRCSSSKPSRPDNDPKDVPANGRSVTTSAASSRSDGKAGGDKRKRKSKEEPIKKLPYVPETHHISKDDVSLSTFFSQHRPISITQSIPKSVTNEHFAAIFTSRIKNNKSISSFANNYEVLETSMSKMTIAGRQQDTECKVDVRNADGTQSSMYLDIDAMSGEFLPYRPPPLPLPQPSTAADDQSPAATDDQSPAATEAAAETASSEDLPHYRKYRAIFTIEETVEADGQYRIVAHTPRIISAASESSFLERMTQRQLRFDESRSRRAMHAISVRRQRKLKMKKKKYKKLQKRTRILRRKGEKA